MGAPAHFALSVRDILNERFPGRWIGRDSPTSPAPLPWPPHSPDLITPDSSLWGIIKGFVVAYWSMYGHFSATLYLPLGLKRFDKRGKN
jgi:hypothetical protein